MSVAAVDRETGAVEAIPLTAQDESFLVFEEPGVPMQVGAIALFEPGSLRAEDGTLDLARIRSAIATRLERLPQLRRRLEPGRGSSRSSWVDCPDLVVAQHVQRHRLLEPSDGEAIGPAIGALLAEPLPRDRPLWCMTILDDGQPGSPFLIVLRAHHALADGVAGVDLLARLLDVAPVESAVPRREPSSSRPSRVPAGERAVTRSGISAFGFARGFARSILGGLRGTTRTPLGVEPALERRHASLCFDHDDLRLAARSLGVSTNDLLVGAASGAAREWLEGVGVDARRARLRAMVPVALRRRFRPGEAGNLISALLVELPTEIDGAVARARAVARRIRHQFARGEAFGPIGLAWLAERLGRWVLVVGSRLTIRRRAYNLVVSSVPGPRQSLRLLDARLRTLSPVIPLFRGQRFAVGGLRYAGGFFVGIQMAGADTASLDAFAGALQRELETSIREGRRVAGDLGARSSGAVREVPSRIDPHRESPADAALPDRAALVSGWARS